MLKASSPKKLKPGRRFNLFWHYGAKASAYPADHCPYCQTREVVKRGQRKKKYETVQLYLCKACSKTFTRQIVKGKHYPLIIILDGVSFYNLVYTQSQACRLLKEKYGPLIKPSTLSNWIEELELLCRTLASASKR